MSEYIGTAFAIATSLVIGWMLVVLVQDGNRERDQRQYEVTCGSERFVVSDVDMSLGGTHLYERTGNRRNLVRSFSAAIPCTAVRIN